jgi:hypothetical protein
MKRRFATRKYLSNKFAPRRFSGDRIIIDLPYIAHIHNFTLYGPKTEYNILLYGPIIYQFEQTIKDSICQVKYM